MFAFGSPRRASLDRRKLSRLGALPRAPCPSTNDPDYDPAFYSDARMNEMARDAGELGWERFWSGDRGDSRDKPGREYIVQDSDVRFRVYIDSESGTGRPIVGNVHPIGN